MKTRNALVAALLLGVALSAPATLAAATEDETAIRELTDSFVNAWNNHDPAAMAATWAQDGDLINPQGRVAKGRDAIQQLLTDEHSGQMKTTTFTLKSLELRMLTPSVALGDWTTELTGAMDPQGNARPPMHVHVFVVYEKRDGKWLAEATRPYSFARPGPPLKTE
jgi:uncharacterized protein (TIGR02246 family)